MDVDRHARRLRSPAAAAILIASALALGACGDDPAPTEPATGTAVEIADFAFAPEQITVKTGSTITWTNSDDPIHTATADDGSFDTGNIDGNGGTGKASFDTAGEFTYYCRPHPFMHGTVTVVDG